MNTGWIKLYRKSMESTVWKNPVVWMIWSWILLKANHGSVKLPFNGSDIELTEGQFITGINKALGEMPSLTAQKYRTAIGYLKLTGRITIKTTNKFSLITIVKWEVHQKDNTQTNKPLTNEQQTNNKQITTNNNDKKVKKVKNRSNTLAETSSAGVPSLTTNQEPKPYLIETPLKKVVCGYKILQGFAKDDRIWDRENRNFARAMASAKLLLESFGSWEAVIDCIEDLKREFQAKQLSWTLETIVKHASKYKMLKEKGEYNGNCI